MNLTKRTIEIRGVRRLAIAVLCAAFGIVTCGSALALHASAQAAANADQAAANADQTAKNPPEYIHVRASTMQGMIVHKVQPIYPFIAQKARVEGTVVLRATINKKGNVENLQVVSGPAMLQMSAMDAVQQWKYRPYLLNGEPVAVKTMVNVSYTLAKKVPPPPPSK